MAGRPALRALGALRALRALRALVAVLAGAALVTASCGGDGGGTTAVTDPSGTSEQAAGSQLSEPVRIRLALAPDPVWQWLEDSGTVAQWEAAHNIRIEASSPFDQFSAFAGGHADVVVINALEVPQFVEQSDRDPVVVGRFTTDRSFLGVRRTSRAETLDDLVEARISVDSALGSALLWGVIADALHGLEFRVGSPDFELVVVESASVADLVMRGDVDACICLPDFSVPDLAGGRLRPLYGGRSAAEVYAQDVAGDPAALPIADAFVADRQWLAQNRDAVGALLGLWEVGLQNWAVQKEALIASYPHLLSVQTGTETAWMTDYAGAHDWVSGSVYLTQEHAQTQTGIFARMQSLGLVPDDAVEPELDLSFSAAA